MLDRQADPERRRGDEGAQFLTNQASHSLVLQKDAEGASKKRAEQAKARKGYAMCVLREKPASSTLTMYEQGATPLDVGEAQVKD